MSGSIICPAKILGLNKTKTCLSVNFEIHVRFPLSGEIVKQISSDIPQDELDSFQLAIGVSSTTPLNDAIGRWLNLEIEGDIIPPKGYYHEKLRVLKIIGALDQDLEVRHLIDRLDNDEHGFSRTSY
jgi:hypothetical protein